MLTWSMSDNAGRSYWYSKPSLMDKLDTFLFGLFTLVGICLYTWGSNACWRHKSYWATVSANSWSEPGLNEEEQLNVLSLQKDWSHLNNISTHTRIHFDLHLYNLPIVNHTSHLDRLQLQT